MAKRKMNFTITDENVDFLEYARYEFHIRPSDVVNEVLAKYGGQFIQDIINAAMQAEYEANMTLEDMLAEGRITQEEYDTLKDKQREEVARDLERFDSEE